jgi:hypothetical protein
MAMWSWVGEDLCVEAYANAIVSINKAGQRAKDVTSLGIPSDDPKQWEASAESRRRGYDNFVLCCFSN